MNKSDRIDFLYGRTAASQVCFDSADVWEVCRWRNKLGAFTVPRLAEHTGVSAERIASILPFLRSQEIVVRVNGGGEPALYRFTCEYETTGINTREMFEANGLSYCRKCRDGVHGHHLDSDCKVVLLRDGKQVAQCNCLVSYRKEIDFQKRWLEYEEHQKAVKSQKEGCQNV